MDLCVTSGPMHLPSKIVRFEPDKKGYEDAMATFMNTLVETQPRSMLTAQKALTISAQRTFTRQFGVEVNILMTKLYGEERTRFGFDDAPETRHFALKVFGMVYEFGPFEERVRKSHSLDWYAEHLDFEFASIVNTNYKAASSDSSDEDTSSYRQRPVVAYTMKTEQEFDNDIQKVRNFGRRYDPKDKTCFCFIKCGLLQLDRNPSPDCEVQRWMAKYQETLSPEVKKMLHFITRNMHRSKWSKATDVIDQVDLVERDQNTQTMPPYPITNGTTPNRPRKRPFTSRGGGAVIAEIDLSCDDNSSSCDNQSESSYPMPKNRSVTDLRSM